MGYEENKINETKDMRYVLEGVIPEKLVYIEALFNAVNVDDISRVPIYLADNLEKLLNSTKKSWHDKKCSSKLERRLENVEKPTPLEPTEENIQSLLLYIDNKFEGWKTSESVIQELIKSIVSGRLKGYDNHKKCERYGNPTYFKDEIPGTIFLTCELCGHEEEY